MDEFKTAISRDPGTPVGRIYDSVIQNIEEQQNVPLFHTVKSQLERYRSSFTPPIPSRIEDVEITDEWGETWQGRRYLSLCDNDWAVSVFATDRNLRKLRECQTIYMDGTFRSCPEPYSQYLTIHGLYNGRVLPLV